MTQWGLDTLFNPAKRHMDEEKRRLQSTREEVGDNSGGKRIDLEAGKVTIRRAEADADADTDTEDAPASEAGAGEATPASSAADDNDGAARPVKELSPAQLRAAKRRGRLPN